MFIPYGTHQTQPTRSNCQLAMAYEYPLIQPPDFLIFERSRKRSRTLICYLNPYINPSTFEKVLISMCSSRYKDFSWFLEIAATERHFYNTDNCCKQLLENKFLGKMASRSHISALKTSLFNLKDGRRESLYMSSFQLFTTEHTQTAIGREGRCEVRCCMVARYGLSRGA